VIATRTECAQEIVEVIPLIVRAMGIEQRGQPRQGLSLPCSRALTYPGRREGVFLSDRTAPQVRSLLFLSKRFATQTAQGLVSLQQGPRWRRRLTHEPLPQGQQTTSRVCSASSEERVLSPGASPAPP
jgi:hypothetical protein